MLALVNMIVSNEPEPIPEMYSRELQGLISKLMEKDPKRRPSVREILKMSLIR